MRITRIQVEEGFLDGLDVELSTGLNVISGARGTGKTSLIELLRFCFDVSGYTPETTRRSRDHALSVLGTGQITVTLLDGDREIVVSRTANDAIPRSSGPYTSPLVFSQTEIESIGLHANGRLKLLDGFAKSKRQNENDETASVAEVQSVSTEIHTTRLEIEEFDRQLVEIASIEKQLAELAPKEQQLSLVSASAAGKKKALDVLSDKLSKSAVAIAQSERLVQALSKWRGVMTSANNTVPSLDVPKSPAATDPLEKVRITIRRVYEQANKSIQELIEVEKETTKIIQVATADKLVDEGKARGLRKEIDALQSGAGAIISAGQQLRERKAQLESLREVANGRRKELAQLQDRRSRALDRLDEVRQRRFNERATAAKRLHDVLGPKIKIGVTRSGQFDIYSSAISDVLRGSGLKYGDLSVQIAERVSPRELIEVAEQNDVEHFAEAAGISQDRALRVLNQVRISDLGALATISVEDDVSLELLDGKIHKGIGDLSMGQRCTVVLPIVLRHTERMLVVDQPEDHIDNAFITDTLIKAIRARGEGSQLLFSTHNANIPVLGDADRVIELSSDGKRGFVVKAAPLKDPEIVDAITTVMEGGLEAFRKRAEFYKDNPPA